MPLKRNALIDDMKLIVTAICQKAKDGNFTKQIVLNSFDKCIKSFESMESLIKSELAGDSKANQKKKKRSQKKQKTKKKQQVRKSIGKTQLLKEKTQKEKACAEVTHEIGMEEMLQVKQEKIYRRKCKNKEKNRRNN